MLKQRHPYDPGGESHLWRGIYLYFSKSMSLELENVVNIVKEFNYKYLTGT